MKMSSNFKPSQYAGKNIMAPMVKIGTLPARLMAIRHGADLVYTEEMIDWKLIRTRRIVNDALETVDFFDDVEGVVVFRTCQEERSKVILQIGTADPERALKAALLVQQDVAGIDINMGCPKEFSMKGGMGAALLRQPEKIKAILTNLIANLNVPVTCKIRVLPNIEDTVKLCEMIQSCGVSGVAIHGRTKDERQQHANRNSYLKAVAEKLTIPVIANGGSKEIVKYEDFEVFRQKTGCSSVMIARAAQWNSSIFRKEGKLQMDDLIQHYIKLSVDYDNAFPNTKYNIQNILREVQESPLGRKFLSSLAMSDICDLWNLTEYYLEAQQKISHRASKKRSIAEITTDASEDTDDTKRPKLETCSGSNGTASNGQSQSSSVIIVPGCVFIRGHYEDVNKLPKSVLLLWNKKSGLLQNPVYETEAKGDKKFQSTVTVGGQKFGTDVWEKNKKNAEQAAALACIKSMKIPS